MPLYEYQCDTCGARFELIRRFSDPPLTTCPKCGAESVRKLVSSPAFQFKGSGWYVTDYAKKSGEGSSTPGTKASESKTDDAKAEAKADAASDSKSDKSDKSETKSGGAATAEKPAAPATAQKDQKDKS